MENEQNHLLETEDEFIEIPTPNFDEVYRNIKHLIYDGFVPVRVHIGDTNIVLKGISPKEFQYIELVSNSEKEKVALYFLYSIVLVDGMEIIPHRSDLHQAVIDMFRRMSTVMVNTLFDMISTVQKYYANSYEALEPYLFEKESRHFWDVYKRDILNSSLIKGFDTLGYNTAQEIWVSFNQREDERTQSDIQFANAKFIASSMVGSKEIQRIERVEKMRSNEEKRRRQDIRLRNKIDKLLLTNPINSAKDLVAELNKQIRGEKDLHDRIIEQHEKQLEKVADERQKQLEDLRIQSQLMNAGKKMIEGGSKSVSHKEMSQALKAATETKQTFEDNQDYHLSKVLQTGFNRDRYAKENEESKKETPPVLSTHKKSMFDPEIQAELAKLKKKPR